jgi:XTP/dITP diphosphohydrolase
MARKLLLATTNAKKLREMRPLLEPFDFELLGLSDVVDPLDVDETGSTFLENARLKATQQASHLDLWTIGEDSGLSVHCLGGEPGIYSARYAGADATDDSNIDLLLNNLETHRKKGPITAFYSSAVVLSDPSGDVQLETYDECHGRILTSRRGEGGFGYDPIFEITEYHQTFAELGQTVKRVLSHRGRALRRFLSKLPAAYPAEA